jgi:O-antigen ligase
LKTFLQQIFSFCSIFVLFLFSYQYKHTIDFFKKYDPTLYLGLIVLIYLICFSVRNAAKIRFNKYHAVFSLFALWLLASYFWSSSSVYSFAKSVRFLVYVVPTFFVSAIVIATSSGRLGNFIVALLTFSGAVLSITLLAYFQNPGSLPNLFGTNYLVTGQTIGLGAVILGVKFFHKKNCKTASKSTLLIGCVIITSLFLELHIGGRGPLLSTLIVLGGLCVMFLKNNPQNFLIISLISVVAFTAGFWLIKYVEHDNLPISLQRIFSEEGIKSLTLRLEYYESALRCFQTHLFKGVGIGGWPDYYGLEKIKNIEWQHPHNIFLEIAAETGLVGLIFFVFLIIALTKKIHTELRSDGPLLTILLCSAVFCFLNAFKSGDLNDNIVLFAFAGLIVGFERKKERECAPFN